MQVIKVVKSNGTVNPITMELNSINYKNNRYTLDSFKDSQHREHMLDFIEKDTGEIEKSNAPVAMKKKTYSFVLTPEGKVTKESSNLDIHEDGTYEYHSVESDKNSNQKSLN